jgi:Transposase DDE domain
MDASIVLWEQWQQQVKQVFEGMHGHQKKTLALVVIGIILASSAVLQRIAESLQLAGISEAKMPSIERRLARFVANERIVVSEVWKHFLSQVLPYWHGKSVRLVLDCTPCGDQATIVYLGLLVQSRVLPLMWRVMPLQEEWEEEQWLLVGRMFDAVQPHLASCSCTLIADRGLTGAPLVKLCRDRQWHYLLRICKEHTVRRKLGQRFSAWTACGVVVHQTGQQWFGRVLCWQQETIDTYLSAVWDADHREAWFLISDQPAGRRRVAEYALRMRVESTFQDAKSRGWDLEASLIADRERLNRLLLALFVAMWWVIHLAASCIHHGQRDRFDRHDRRDKGLFRLGCLWLKDILRRVRTSSFAAATLTWCLPFRKTASGWRFSLRF